MSEKQASWADVLTLLKRIEWVDTSDGEYGHRCPDCGAERHGSIRYRGEDGRVQFLETKPRRHASDCDLAAFANLPKAALPPGGSTR